MHTEAPLRASRPAFIMVWYGACTVSCHKTLPPGRQEAQLSPCPAPLPTLSSSPCPPATNQDPHCPALNSKSCTSYIPLLPCYLHYQVYCSTTTSLCLCSCLLCLLCECCTISPSIPTKHLNVVNCCLCLLFVICRV